MTLAEEASEEDPTSPQSDTPSLGGDGASGAPSSSPLPPLPSYSRGNRYSRRHHRHRRRTIFRFKRKESNILAAVCSMIVMLLMCTAMAEPQWFYLKGGGCRQINPEMSSGPQYESVHYLGITQFFYMGKFIENTHHSHSSGKAVIQTTAYNYGPGSTDSE